MSCADLLARGSGPPLICIYRCRGGVREQTPMMIAPVIQPALELTLSIENWILIAVVIAAAVAGVFAWASYKKCPADRILVIYGKVGGGRSHKCLHGGGAFVLPMVQDYTYMSLEPIEIEVPLEGAVTRDKLPINVPSTFTVAISTDPRLMDNAVERLLNMPPQVIREQAEAIIVEQLRLVIAELTVDEINLDREKFQNLINEVVGNELARIGLYIINVNVRDITDDAGYLEGVRTRAVAELRAAFEGRAGGKPT